MNVSLDNIDVQILAELQSDADRTNLELSRVIGLSPAATMAGDERTSSSKPRLARGSWRARVTIT